MFALQFCHNLHVLDAACGAGYGTAYLSSVAETATGVDISNDAVEYAKTFYSDFENTNYEVGNVCSLASRNDFFDTVVSFETLEHLKDLDSFLLEVIRVLKPSGKLIISVPDAKTNRDAGIINPFHFNELLFEEFSGLLNKYFNFVTFYCQELPKPSKYRAIATFLLKPFSKQFKTFIKSFLNKKITKSTFNGLNFIEFKDQNSLLVDKVKPKHISEYKPNNSNRYVFIAVCNNAE